MELIKWNPRKSFFHPFHSVFDDFFYPRSGREEMVMQDWNPAVDIYEEDGKIIVKAEMPGVDKKDIHVDVKDRVLTLKGERSIDNESKEDSYYRRERCYGKFERQFTLPADVDSETIEADYKDGVLKISVPEPEKQKPKQITIH